MISKAIWISLFNQYEQFIILTIDESCFLLQKISFLKLPALLRALLSNMLKDLNKSVNLILKWVMKKHILSIKPKSCVFS